MAGWGLFAGGVAVGLAGGLLIALRIGVSIDRLLSSRLAEEARRRRIMTATGLDRDELGRMAREAMYAPYPVDCPWDKRPEHSREDWRRAAETVVHAVLDAVTVCCRPDAGGPMPREGP